VHSTGQTFVKEILTNVAGAPFEEDHETQITENAPQEQNFWKKFEEDVVHFVEVEGIQ